jgi:DNA-binding protein Fis
VLSFTGGNKARSARILGITAATLYNKLKLYRAQDGAS